jgi:serine protease AprX
VKSRHNGRTKVFIGAALLALGLPAVAASSNSLKTVVVEGQTGGIDAVATTVTELGGTIIERIDLIDGVIARVPADAVSKLGKSKAVKVITVDTSATVTGTTPMYSSSTLSSVTASIGADEIHHRGTDGWNVDIALIDSGVNSVKGMDDPDQLVSLDDLSPTKTKDSYKKLDQFGHGTHLAGIMLLNDPKKEQVGIAPGSRVVSMKVADQSGDVSLTSVLQALERVVDQRYAYGMNIRIINLSIGFDADSAAGVLVMRAAERAVEQGIVVVAAAGNGGSTTRSLVSPAASPSVIAVGASDTHGTPDRGDDTVATFSSGSQDGRSPDVLAPGVGIVSARVSGSVIDTNFPAARRGKQFFSGSGSSQSAAVVSGAVALLLDEQPTLTPAQVKELLRSTATRLPGASTSVQGAGEIDIAAAIDADTPTTLPAKLVRVGRMSNAAQAAVVDPMTGEVDGTRWTGTRWTGTRWTGSEWI